jgi:hypothetical protein
MKKPILLFLGVCVLVCSFTGLASATIYTFKPGDYAYLNTPDPNDKARNDLWDLAHQNWYTWGINFNIPIGETIIWSSLSFDNIRNWTTETNHLYANLLPVAVEGVFIGNDNQAIGNYYETPGNHLLFDWSLGTSPQDKIHVFDSDDLNFLRIAILGGNFGLAFDPDCHYYNDGVELKVETAPVPEPTTILLVSSFQNPPVWLVV